MAIRVGDLGRVTNRNRRGSPSHGDIGKITDKNAAVLNMRIIRAAEGSQSSVGEVYAVNVNDVEAVDIQTQKSLLMELVNAEQDKIAKATTLIAQLNGRIKWLEQYGSEENAIVTTVIDIVKSAGSKEEAEIRVKEALKGKVSFY